MQQELDLFSNYCRPANLTDVNIIEFGMGDDLTATSAKSNKRATVDPGCTNGFALGHDCFADDEYSMAYGSFQKAIKKHAISEGMWYSKAERYGEKRRTFADHNNKNSRGWFEWYGSVNATPGFNNPAEIYLHGVTNERLTLVDFSCLIYNIKIVGMDGNSSPKTNGYHLSGVIRRGNGAANTALIGTEVQQAWEDTAALNAYCAADTTNGALKLFVLTDQSNTWKWAASGWVTELRY